MNWIGFVIALALLAALLLVRRIGQVSPSTARTHFQNGALLIDVRSKEEFASGHLPKAMNMPVNEIESLLPRRVPDRNHVLLLYCESGMRSGIARRKLRALGYTQALQLGSYGRAAHILGGG